MLAPTAIVSQPEAQVNYDAEEEEEGMISP
jgi:hypothetical protein